MINIQPPDTRPPDTRPPDPPLFPPLWYTASMNCPKCNTWNPDDKNYCWRCGATMPKPVEQKTKRKRAIFGLPIWMWLVIALFFASLLVGQWILMGMRA